MRPIKGLPMVGGQRGRRAGAGIVCRGAVKTRVRALARTYPYPLG